MQGGQTLLEVWESSSKLVMDSELAVLYPTSLTPKPTLMGISMRSLHFPCPVVGVCVGTGHLRDRDLSQSYPYVEVHVVISAKNTNYHPDNGHLPRSLHPMLPLAVSALLRP
jgi:hypothetical protein